MCRYLRELARDFSNPPTANHNILLIKDNSLSRGDGALRRVKGDQSLAIFCGLNGRGRRLMAMTNFGMGVPLMHMHASMQMERLQDGDGRLGPSCPGQRKMAKNRRMRLPWIFDRFRSR